MRLLVVCLLALAASPDALLAQRSVASHDAAAPAIQEVARVNGVPIPSHRLDMALNRIIPMESFHRTVTPEKLAAFRQRALDGLIDDELQYQEGRRLAVGVTDAEVKAEAARFAALGPAAAQAEARRALTIKKARDRAVTASCRVDRVEAERFFVANPARFVVPEQVRILAITIGVDPSATTAQWERARDTARDVLRQIKAGAAFADMARLHSTDGSRATGGDMGFVHRGSLSDEFEQALATLPPGEPSDVVQTIYGYHIVQIAEVRPPQAKTFAEVSTDLVRDLTAERCEQASKDWIARLRAGAAIVMTPPAPADRAVRPPG